MERFQIKNSLITTQYHADHQRCSTEIIANFCHHCGTPIAGQLNQLSPSVQGTVCREGKLKFQHDNYSPLRSMVERYPDIPNFFTLPTRADLVEGIGWLMSFFITSWLFFSLTLSINNFDLSNWSWLLIFLYGWSPLFLSIGVILIWLINKIFSVDRPQHPDKSSAYWVLFDLTVSLLHRLV